MDKWNRRDQNEYTGISAQRRNRRKAGSEPAVPESAPRASVFPGKQTAAAGTAYTAGMKGSAEEESLERIKRFMKPETPAEPEEPAEPDWGDEPAASAGQEAPVIPGMFSFLEEPAEEEVPAEAEDAGEPAASAGQDTPVIPGLFSFLEEPAEADEPAETEEPAEPEESGEAAGTAEPEKTEEPEASAGAGESDEAEETAEAEEPAGTADFLMQETREEPAFVAQSADSRVPPEARRMAETPYGSVSSAGRSAASLQETRRQPIRTEGRKPAVRPRYVGSADARKTAAPRPGNARVHVGYAPGRMSDDMTQQIPSGEAVRESLYSRDARAYLEKRKQPFKVEETRKPAPGGRMLRIVVALLVLAGIALTVFMLLKNKKADGPVVRQVPNVSSFTAYNTEGEAPADVGFVVETDKDVEGIRMRGEGDMDLDTDAEGGVNADGKLWGMRMHVETGFKGTVYLQVRRSEAEGWYDTAYTAELDIKSPNGMEPILSIPQEEDEDDDYYNPEEEPGDSEADAEGKAAAAVPETEPAGEAGEEPAEDQEGGTADLWKGDDGELPEDEDGDGFADPADIPDSPLKTQAPTAAPVTATPEPTTTPPLTAEGASEADPGLITNVTVYTGNTKKVKDYSRPAKEMIHMPAADAYTKQQLGVMTFRGDNFRRNAAVGTLSAAPAELDVLWKTEAGSARGTNQTFYGYGWTGQPVIARWSVEVRSHSNITEAADNNKKEKKGLKEVIIAGVDGSIRFLDLEDGAQTRSSVRLGYPMRGTPSLHTRGVPFMSVGQFARKMKNKTGKIGLRQYNLFTAGEMKLIDGLDGKYHRPVNDVGSFETSALIDRESDTLIAVGTNGALYLEFLDTNFDYNTGVLTISPSITVMTSKVKGQKNKALLAVESSPAAYDKYVYYADMGGVLRCVDTNNLKPVWAVETGDSVMAAVALDLAGDPKDPQELNLYTANMLNNRKKGNSNIQIRRYDALSGKEAWKTEVGVYKGKKDKDDVGAKASPVIGQNNLKDLVYFTVTGLSEEGQNKLGLGGEKKAALIALEKDTGRIVWSFGLSSRCESSPIALYDTAGNGWILQCEQNGTVHLLEGRSGSEISKLELGAEIEASPAAYNNVVVIGTTGKDTSFVYGLVVKLDQTQDSGEEPAQPAESPDQPEENGEAGEAPEEEYPDDLPEEGGEEDWPDEDSAEWEEGGAEDEEIPGGA